ncbi:MAG: inorganic phosphate transporter [Ignisphaera sp.]
MFSLFIVGLALSAAIAWSIGGNDTVNSIDAIVGGGVLDIKKTMTLFATSQAVGAVVQGYMVMKTIGRGVVPDIDVVEAVAATLATFTWITIATLKGVPISTTHSVTSAVIGIGIAKWLQDGLMSINIDAVLKIIISWISSPLASIALAIPLYHFFSWMFSRWSIDNTIAKVILIFVTAFSAYSFGANDVGNATSVYVTITSRYLGIPDAETMRFLAIFASFFIALGGFTVGKKVVETLAFKITRLDIPMAMASEASNALVVWIFTTLPYMLFGYGLPISTTYATAGSIIGVDIAKNRGLRGVNVKTIIFIMGAWILTLPLVASASIAIYFLIKTFVGVTM